MNKEHYDHEDAGNLTSVDRGCPLIRDIDEFIEWFKILYDFKKLKFDDWREDPDPNYIFCIKWGEDIGWEEGEIRGFIPEDGDSIFFEDHTSSVFVLDFLKKFVARFPDCKENLIFFDEYGDLSRYDEAISEDDLKARIELRDVDQDLMDRMWNGEL